MTETTGEHTPTPSLAAFLTDIERWHARLPADSAETTLQLLLFRRLADARCGTSRPPLPSSPAPNSADAPAPPGATEAAALRSIVDELYSSASPYAFESFPVDVLGQVHEHLLQRHRPNARKSSGAYYTPDRVVRYILNGTLGALLEGQAPDSIAHLALLDPACGSGFFLLAAFEQLIEWHRNWYLRDADAQAPGDNPALYRHRDGTYRLTQRKLRALAQNHLYGVDLDPAAVRITQLSLSLLCLTDENVTHELTDENLARERATEVADSDLVVDLTRNIVAGNSLLDSRFDYRRAFPAIFERGGFDAVIGNPPYLSYGGRQVATISAQDRAQLAKNYALSGWTTAHSFFMERASTLLSRRWVSFIVPDQVGHLDGYRSLREIMLRQGGLTEVKYWGEKVFKGVVTPSLTFFFDKQARAGTTRVVNTDGSEHSIALAAGSPWTWSPSTDLMAKLSRRATSIRSLLGDCGVRTTRAREQVVTLERATGQFVPVLEGKLVGRYFCAPPSVAVRLDSGQPVFRAKDERYERARFVIRQTAPYPIAGPREHAVHFRNSLHALYAPEGGVDVKFVVGLLNSKLLRFAYVVSVREARQRVFPQVKLGPLGRLPVRLVDLQDHRERERHDRIVTLVDGMLDLRRRTSPAPRVAPAEQSHDVAILPHAPSCAETPQALKAEFDALDAQLDDEVFSHYELSPADISEVLRVVDDLPIPP